jgi:GT2 family glycosyltransferase
MSTLGPDSRRSTVAVTIVTYNSRRYIGLCLEALLRESAVPMQVVVVDNASTDSTSQVLAGFAGRIRVIWNRNNVGFAAAQNQAIAASNSDWVLALNPDVLVTEGFVERLLEAGEIDSKVGTVCGKLRSIGPDFHACDRPRIDSAGIYFTPTIRHFDRGWGAADEGQFERMEYVFGASAAAALYRRRMIEDIAESGEFFDPDFFAYREDADVAWRAQLLGWRSLYTPAALAYHVRTVIPGNRLAVPAVLNMHSVKNRFLMRIKNMTPGLYRRCWLPVMARDATVLAACLIYEQSSLAAFWHLGKCFRRALRRRRAIMARRRVSDESLACWFNARPASQPLGAAKVAEYDGLAV